MARQTKAGAPAAPTIAAKAMASIRERLLAAAVQLKATFVDRDDAIDAVLLGHVVGEHVLLIGSRGTAKSSVLERFAMHVTDATRFQALYGAFTTPTKVFGPDSIQAFKEGRYEVVTDGMLPKAQLARLEEVMKAPDGVLGEHLVLLNEREFPAGVPCPLHCAVAATNWPEVESRSERIQPLYDRFLLRVAVRGLEGKDATERQAKLVKLLKAADRVRDYAPEVGTTVSMEELLQAHAEARAVVVPDWVQEDFAKVVDQLSGWDAQGRRRGIDASPRRVAQLQDLMRASAWLRGSTEVTIEDFWPLRFGLWENKPDVEMAEQALSTIDHAYVQKATTAVDRGRQALRRAEAGGTVGTAAGADAANAVTAAAQEAREVYDGPKLTAAGRKKVEDALGELRGELETFIRRHPSAVAGFKAKGSKGAQGEVANG